MAGHGKTRQGKAWQDKARQGKARQGKARQGKARHGTARQGKMRTFFQGQLKPVPHSHTVSSPVVEVFVTDDTCDNTCDGG
jgi:hypothetical protein